MLIIRFFAYLIFVLLATGCSGSGPAAEEERAAPEAQLVSEQPVLTETAMEFSTEYLMGRFDPATHPDFIVIEPTFTNKKNIYLRRDTYEAFRRMHAAAERDGVKLVILSATRNFAAQKGIWEAKWTGARKVDGMDLSQAIPDARERALKILEYSSMPGTSRHHWGTDIDLNSLNNAFFEKGEGQKIYAWLTAHAAEFGFCQPYTPKGPARPDGYNEERWHWSYMPVGKKLTTLARRSLKDEMVTGFQGSEAATRIGVVEKYVLGVSAGCL